MNALSAIAKQIQSEPTEDGVAMGIAKSILAMKRECPVCTTGRGEIGAGKDGKVIIVQCYECNGTGKSDLPVIAEVCQDQKTLTWDEIEKICQQFRLKEGSDDCICYAIKEVADKMKTESIDENGRKVKWVKVYCEPS